MIKRTYDAAIASQDWLRVLAAAGLGLGLGWLAGWPGFGLALGLGGILVWHLHRLSRLLAWIRGAKEISAPDDAGVYEELCTEVDRLRERHKKRKKKLAGYLKQFQQATSALPDATLVLGPDNEIRWANAAAAKFLGIHWPHDSGNRLNHLLRTPELLSLLEEEGGILRPLEMPAPTDAERQLSIQIVPYGAKERLFVARDVTRLHKLSEMRSDFVANVSHELRTPLTVFTGYVDTLLDNASQGPKHWRAAFEQMQTHAFRMQQVVDELLTLSRLEQSEHTEDDEVVSVPTMLSRLIAQAQEMNPERKQIFRIDLDSELALLGSANELHSAFSNLIFNAVKYTPERGRISVIWERDGEGARLTVRDSGIGIPEQHIDRLTERFYRVDKGRSREKGGTGLGLAIVKHVLTRHNSALEISSVVDEGSTFSCYFPALRIVELEPLEADLNRSA